MPCVGGPFHSPALYNILLFSIKCNMIFVIYFLIFVLIGAKPFKCPFCDVSFRTSSHRKSHLMVAHMPNRRRHAESRKAKIRRMLESVASTLLNLETEQETSKEINENTSLGEISNPLQVIYFK